MIAFQRPGSSSFDLPSRSVIISYAGRFLSVTPVLSLTQFTTMRSSLNAERHSLYLIAHSFQGLS